MFQMKMLETPLKSTVSSFDWASAHYDITRNIPNELIVQISNIFKNEIEIKPSDLIFDIGVGTGRISLILSELLDLKLVGIDISEKMLKKCYTKSNKMKSIYLVQADAFFVPFSCKFNLILVSHLFHLIQSKYKVLEDILCFLKNTGHFILLDAYVNYQNSIPFQIYYEKLAEYDFRNVHRGNLTHKDISLHLIKKGWKYFHKEVTIPYKTNYYTIVRFLRNQVYTHLRKIDYETHLIIINSLFNELEKRNIFYDDTLELPASAIISIFNQ